MFLRLLLSAPSALAVSSATSVKDAIETVSNTLSSAGKDMDLGSLALFVLQTYFVPALEIIALVFVVYAAVLLTISQSEEQLGKARMALIGSLAGIILINVAVPLSAVLIGVPGGSIGPLATEAESLLSYVEEPIAILAILMILISGIRAVISYGSDEGLTHIKRTIMAVTFGIVLVVSKVAIRGSVIAGDAGLLVREIVRIVNILVGFTALLALGVIVYAGILMVANVGNDEQYGRAKSLILRVGIGLAVLLLSAVIANVFFGIAS